MPEKNMPGGKEQMKIAGLSRQSGVSVSTLYDYLRSGLLPPPEKESPTKSYFTRAHLDRLKDIRNLKGQGYSMAEIKERLVQSNDGDMPGMAEDNVRQAIVDKALSLFASHHYENTKISDITQSLNMGNGTFYRYFKSKEELFLDCLKRLPRVLVPHDAWEEVKHEPDYIERLKKRGYAMLNAFPSYIGILTHAKLALGGADDVLAARAAECIRSLVRPLEKDLEQAIANGRVRPVDVSLCAYLLLGINETFGHLLIMDPERSVEKDFAVIEDFIGHALAPEASGPADRSFSAEVTDCAGNVFILDQVLFEREAKISGKYLEGELCVDFKDIERMAMAPGNEGFRIILDLTGRSQVSLSITPESIFSGRTPFGYFTIESRSIRQVRWAAPSSNQ